LYQNYRQWAFNEFSNPDKVSFFWFRNYLIVKFSLSLIGLLNSLYTDLSHEQGNAFYALMWWGYLADTVLMYYLSIAGYTQPHTRTIRFKSEESFQTLSRLPSDADTPVFDEAVSQPIPPPATDGDLLSKPSNKLSEADLTIWKNKLLTYFDKETPYLNPELTLSDLATKLKTNTSILSQVINTGFGKNFNDFVNEYRVETFKSKIKTPQYQHLTMLAVAFECGFNSKTTFNRAFKKSTNQNPSDYHRA
jgi:AraC-like DNA-binding protein